MSEDRPPAGYMPPSESDLVPGMVTVADDVNATTELVIDRPPQLIVHTPAPAQGQDEGFDLVLRGYDRHQVDGYLARVAVLIQQLQDELAASTGREQAYSAELDRVRADLERGHPSYDALGERVGQMLGLAEKEAAQLRGDAKHDATALRRAAEREAADIRSDARREAEELGAAARREVSGLEESRVRLLTDIASIRDTLNGILSDTAEWPSLAPSEESGASTPTEAES